MSQAISHYTAPKQSIVPGADTKSLPSAMPSGYSRKNAVNSDGIFSRYQPLSNESAQQVAMQRMELNAAVGTALQKMRSSNKTYHEFQHNGHQALLMRPAGTENYHLSFQNGHAPTSFFSNLFHPSKPFQFSINGSTNQIVQTQGKKLSQGEMVAALQAVNMSL